MVFTQHINNCLFFPLSKDKSKIVDLVKNDIEVHYFLDFVSDLSN